MTWQCRTARRKREQARRGRATVAPEPSALPGYEERDLVRAALAELDSCRHATAK